MEKLYRKDTTVNILKTTKAAIIKHIPKKIKISPWLEEAIFEKIERECTKENVVLQRNNSPIIIENNV